MGIMRMRISSQSWKPLDQMDNNFAIHFPQLWPTVYMGVSENVVYRHIAILVGMAINRQISKLF